MKVKKKRKKSATDESSLEAVVRGVVVKSNTRFKFDTHVLLHLQTNWHLRPALHEMNSVDSAWLEGYSRCLELHASFSFSPPARACPAGESLWHSFIYSVRVLGLLYTTR